MADGPRRPGSPQSPDGAPSPDKRTLGEEGIYLFMEEFTDETCKNAIAFIISHNIHYTISHNIHHTISHNYSNLLLIIIYSFNIICLIIS